ncbi:hypothetical protein [Streptomyces sp. NPDC004065]|uniref:hypothetical protein n=1 Tax=Streptomyces TaxID=1883 RepID=UPI000AFD0BC2
MIRRWYAKRDGLSDINTRLDLVNLVFRDQDDDPTYTPHLWAYDHDKLVQLFTEAGFTAVEPWTFDSTMANPKRQWGSVYVIATKQRASPAVGADRSLRLPAALAGPTHGTRTLRR